MLLSYFLKVSSSFQVNPYMSVRAVIYVDLFKSCHTERSHAAVSSDSIILLTAGNETQIHRIARARKGTTLLHQMSIFLIAPTYQIHFPPKKEKRNQRAIFDAKMYTMVALVQVPLTLLALHHRNISTFFFRV